MRLKHAALLSDGRELAAALWSETEFGFLFFLFLAKASRLDKPGRFSGSLSLEPGGFASRRFRGDHSGPAARALDEGKCPFAEKLGRGPAGEAGTEQRPAPEHSECSTLSLLLLGQEALWSLHSPCSRLMPKIIPPNQQGLITRAVNSLISLF